jgi:UDP-3-O-[3-hydroxymyristoyl] glucosamine N-acyltransferase
MEFSLEEIARRIGGTVRGDPHVRIRSVAPIASAAEGDITFISNPRYKKALSTTQATAIIVPPELRDDSKNLLVSENSYLAFAKVMELIYGTGERPGCGVSPLAHVDPQAEVGQDVNILPGATVGARARIGEGCDLFSGVYVGQDARVGTGTRLYPNVVVMDGCTVGSRVIIHAGTVIGSDGFGFARDGGAQYKIQQVGNVVVEDDVEIGANCSVDRAVLGSTIVGAGTKMDNLIQVGHNTVIGPNCTIVAQVGIAGSTKIGANTVIAAQVGIAGHLEIGDNVEIAARSAVIGPVRDNEKVLGIPATDIQTARKAYAVFYSLPGMRREISRLRKELKALGEKLGGDTRDE